MRDSLHGELWTRAVVSCVRSPDSTYGHWLLTSFSWVVNSLKSAPFGSAVQLYSSGQGVTVSLVVKGVVFRLYLST